VRLSKRSGLVHLQYTGTIESTFENLCVCVRARASERASERGGREREREREREGGRGRECLTVSLMYGHGMPPMSCPWYRFRPTLPNIVTEARTTPSTGMYRDGTLIVTGRPPPSSTAPGAQLRVWSTWRGYVMCRYSPCVSGLGFRA